ncbi:MAG: acyl carrier protein [Pirellulales bacterium]|nr:acyl carrier protein [Pirellulales bacterium]
MTLAERLSNIFFNAFGLEKEKFSPALAPEDVANWDSIGHMNMVMDLEKEFDLRFEVDEIMEMSSPQKILDILKARGVPDRSSG